MFPSMSNLDSNSNSAPSRLYDLGKPPSLGSLWRSAGCRAAPPLSPSELPTYPLSVPHRTSSSDNTCTTSVPCRSLRIHSLYKLLRCLTISGHRLFPGGPLIQSSLPLRIRPDVTRPPPQRVPNTSPFVRLWDLAEGWA